MHEWRTDMVTENIKKQLADFKKQGKSLAYLINYISGMIEKEDDYENIILKEMKSLAFDEKEIVECLEYKFSLDMSWHKMSVNYKNTTKVSLSMTETT